MTDVFMMVGASFTLITLLMFILWGVYLFLRNAGIADLGWTLSFLIAAWAYFFLGNGNLLKMILAIAMVTIWACRLFIYTYKRYETSSEDPRYTRLREKWGGESNEILFLILFVFQGVLVILVSLPVFIISLASTSEWSKWEFIGIAIWLLGGVGEGFADSQLEAFHKNPENKNKVLSTGLWRFSRHPNYFFEFLIWVGFFLFALPSYGGIFAILSPIIMLVLLTKVSGIPLTEEQALLDKGDLYRDYQRTTSSFFPWFPVK
jgi:steroid 5-alpha reductase family enzyme